MKYNPLALTLAASFVMAGMAPAQIVIKPVRTPTVSTNQPGIIVPGPHGGATPVAQKPQVIELLNGDALRGTFLGFDSKGGAKWRHPAAKDVIVFEAGSVSRVLLHPRPAQVPASQNSRVTLRTGEELLGELVALNDKTLTLSAWYSRNSLRIPREKILSISLGATAANVIYEGPKNNDGWIGRNQPAGLQRVPQRIQIRGGLIPPAFGRPIGGRAGWQFSKGTFTASRSGAQIGRKVKFADQTNIEFDLAWNGSLNLAVHIYSDKMEQYGGTGYIIGLSNSNCYLIRSTQARPGGEGGQNNIGNASLPQQFRVKTKARISIRADRKNNTVVLLMDNQLIRKWTDSTGFVGKGEVLMFLSQGSAILKVSRIRITRWDGKLPLAGGAQRKSEHDQLLSQDSDLSGKLIGITNGKVQFKSNFLNLNMPLENVLLLRFAGDQKEKTKIGLGDVRVSLVNGGDFSFRLERWSADKVTGVSPIFGKVNFRPSAFISVEFNLNKKREAEGDDPFNFE
jgi:hypothetical protein